MGFGSILKKVAGAIPGLNTVMDIGDLVLGGASLLSGNKKQKKADSLASQQLAMANQNWQAREPLRKMALSGLQNTQRPDLSSLFAGTQNPFARPMNRAAVYGAPQPPAGGPIAPQAGPDMGQPPIGPQGALQRIPPDLRRMGRMV